MLATWTRCGGEPVFVAPCLRAMMRAPLRLHVAILLLLVSWSSSIMALNVTSVSNSSATADSTTIPSNSEATATKQKQEGVAASEDEDEPRVYHFRRCKGAGCPYTASWLSHINLYRRVGWFLESTKMEAASFNIFDRSQQKYQLSEPDAYYVHHMSMFEHLLHKKYGFETAKNRTQIMSDLAFKGECEHLNMTSSREYLSLIPFYGGLPPEVTADYSQVKSIGQGNSLVTPQIKVLQCMATLCSTLRYFGQAVIGVTRDDDRELITSTLARMDAKIRRRAHVLQLSMPKPAHLPFHLLAWGQKYVKEHNCRDFPANGDRAAADKKIATDPGVFSICTDERLEKQHRGGPVNVTYHRKSRGHTSNTTTHAPIRFVYYTEMDQIVRFDSLSTLRAISKASNDSCFFVGRRREKDRDSSPLEYMGALNSWRECGEPGYSFSWPADPVVRLTT